MSDHLWSAPAHRVDAESARRSVLAQHVQIRSLLERARETAETTLEDAAPAPDAVASAIGDIRTTMEVHLSFEEKVLVPLLEADPPLGPVRAHHMLDEHRRQRAMLAGLDQEAMACPALPMLAVKLTFLARWLLTDMAEEESEMAVRADPPVLPSACAS